MGKSFMAHRLFGDEHSAVVVRIDHTYNRAVFAAGMSHTPELRSESARTARRYARDRRWPSEEGRKSFFRAYRREVTRALKRGSRGEVTVVLDGGTLSRRDEVKLILRCVGRVNGNGARVVRAHVRLPYEVWLRNRVARMTRSGVEDVRLAVLLEEAYEREVRKSAPGPVRGVEDRTIASYEEMRAFAQELHEVSHHATQRPSGDRYGQP